MYLWSFFYSAYLNQNPSIVSWMPKTNKIYVLNNIWHKSYNIKSIMLSANGYKVSFEGDKNILEFVLIVLQACDYTKDH